MKSSDVGIFVTLILILSIFIVSANPYITLGMKGIQAMSPQAASIIGQAMCVSNPMSCAVSWGQGQVLGELAKASPEIGQAVNMYNQVDGYVGAGAEITSEMEIGKNGGLESGEIKFGSERQEFGNMIGDDLEAGDISGSGISLDKADGISSVTFEDGGEMEVKGDKFENIQEGGEMELDSDGNVKSADLTSSEATSFTFDGETVSVPEGTRVTYENGEISIHGKDKSFSYSSGEGDSMVDYGDIEIKGEGISISGGETGQIISGEFSNNGINFDGTVRLDGEGSYSLMGSETIATLPDGGEIIGGGGSRIWTSEVITIGGVGNEYDGLLSSSYGSDVSYMYYDPYSGLNTVRLTTPALSYGNYNLKTVNLMGGAMSTTANIPLSLDYSGMSVSDMMYFESGGVSVVSSSSGGLFNRLDGMRTFNIAGEHILKVTPGFGSVQSVQFDLSF
jgi:hypothetical protein